jgi:uncharacterized protein DUF3298
MTDLKSRLNRAAVAMVAFALTWQAFAPQARADEPDYSLKTKNVEISVSLDKALRSYPGLAANFLAEGKAWAEKMSAGADQGRHNDPGAFRDGMKWSYDRDYSLRSAIGYYVSVVRSDDTFEGGAHPNHLNDTILWDAGAQKRISIRSLFTETADNGPTMKALAQQARLAVARVKIANGIPVGDADKLQPDITLEDYLKKDTFITDGIKPALLGIGPVTLAPSADPDKSSGLTFHYSPYAVGPYAEGAYIAFVPWTMFRQYLSHQGEAIFGGTRPKSDADKW